MNRMKLLALALLLSVPARAYDTIRFLEPIKGDELARPVAAAAAADRLYVVDEKKNSLFLYDATGRLIKSVGRSGDQPGAFDEPRGVAVGPSGKVYVADTGNHRVEIFDRDGNFVYAFGEKGSEPGKLKNPESVAVGADGRIYVSDTGNNRVQVFTEEGILLFLFGRYGKEPGLLNHPTRIAVDQSDNVFVLDRNNERVQKFDSAAKFVKEYALLGNDFTADQYGFLYVLDGKNGKVIEQSGEGFIMGRFGSLGTGVGQMRKAEGIAITPDGILIVLDTGNNRIHRVELANKLKVKPLPLNLRTKMSVSGPSRKWPYSASVLAPHGDDLYAWLPKEMQFVLIDEKGKEKQRFGSSKGKGGEVTRGVGGMAAMKSAKVEGLYVTDLPNHRLQQFGLDGKWKSNVGEAQGFFDSKKREGRMKNPHGVAINGQGVVYVADTGNQRIDAFSPEGVFLFGFGPKVGSYMLLEPVAVAWDDAGFVYFVDKGLKRVFKCEPSGAYISSWGADGDGPGEFKSPVSIAFDGQNYLYTLDSELRRVSVHTKDGKWLADFFAGGKQERELLEPIAVSVQGDKLVIADKGKSRLVSYDLHPMLTSPAAVSSSTKDGIVALAWEPVADPWTSGYVVSRATGPHGPWATAGETKKEKFEDSDVTPYEKYWYRVATKAKTSDVGPAGRPIDVFVAGSFNRSPVEISTITLGDIFAANYKWYLRNPMGTAVLTNNVNVAFQNVKLTFKLKDYMDFGFDTEVKRLDPKQTVEIPLIATLNNKVLEVSEDTPIQAEFTMTYFESGKQQTVSITKPLRLYSRNAITWQDPRRIANFVTRKDPPVRDFVRSVSTLEFKNRKAGALNEPTVKAMRIWNALSEYGIKFVANPANPFEAAHDDPNFPVDYTQFPRETLRSKAGQCSDLTSLYAAMLEDSEVRVAILDYPGHMTMMFDTEAEDASEAGMPADLLVEHEGTMWVPIEVTFIGKPFIDAVSKAAYAYKTEAGKGRVKVYALHGAWSTYEPVTMPPTDFSPKFPETAALERRYDDQVNVLAKDRYQFLKKEYQADIKRNGKDADAQLQLGIIEYQFGNREAALTEFNKVLALDPANAAALNNLGSVAFLEGDNVEAERRFTQAADAEPNDPTIWLNLVKTSLRLKKTDKARAMGEKAVALAPGFKPAVDSLIKGS
ncbi:MAG: tetratricopeptide repeat protein [Elusimicrobia bacterium]|nr:tetratricopeptide repeat protein [Elusimicrobiota bacterium]